MSITVPTPSPPPSVAPVNGHQFHAEAREPGPPALAQLRGGWLAVVIAIGVMAALVALGGMVLSFRAVSSEMLPSFGKGWSSLVPLVADLSVFVFSGVDLVLEKLDMPHPLARWTVYGATFGTVYLNYNAGGTLPGRIAHVLMPAIWVVFIELMRHVVRRRVSLETGSHREPIPAARWFLAPWPTAKLWRRMVLWRINSYTNALAAERRRLAAIATVREVHGVLWRWKVSPLLRMQIAMGELGADSLKTLLNPGHDDGQNAASGAATPAATNGQSGGQNPAKPPASNRPKRGQDTATRVDKSAAKHPDWTAKQVAVSLGIGERTARRYMTGNLHPYAQLPAPPTRSGRRGRTFPARTKTLGGTPCPPTPSNRTTTTRAPRSSTSPPAPASPPTPRRTPTTSSSPTRTSATASTKTSRTATRTSRACSPWPGPRSRRWPRTRARSVRSGTARTSPAV